MKLLLLSALLALQVPAPAPVQTPAEKPKEKPAEKPVYDEQADARAQVQAALARAKRDSKRVLVQWGANWCGWCIKLDAACRKDKELGRELLYEYELVKVDVGNFNKHMDLAEQYGAKLKDSGIPYLTVLDVDGKVVANQDTGALEVQGEGKHDVAKVLAFFKQHEVARPDGAKAWDAALARAKGEGKRVFLHFGAPWCGWCHKLEDWMAQPEIAALLAKDFVDLKLDVDRATGAKEIQARFPRSEKQGIPWFVFLDAEGRGLIDSIGPKGNTGFPQADEERAHFRTMLEKARQKLTAEEIGKLVDSLAPPKK